MIRHKGDRITCYRCGKTFIVDATVIDRRFKVLESDGCWNYNDINLCTDCHKELVSFLRNGADKTQKVVTGEVEKFAKIDYRIDKLFQCVSDHNKYILDLQCEVKELKEKLKKETDNETDN